MSNLGVACSCAYSTVIDLSECSAQVSGVHKRNTALILHVQALEAIHQLRATLNANGGRYLLGTLSYADVVMAITVAGICPPGKPRQLPPARAAVQIQSQEMHDALKDLQPWADELLDKHLP